MSLKRWDHQQKGVQEVLAAIESGCKRILLSSPTGGGKTQMALDLAEEFTAREMPVLFYTNRKLLIEQTSRVLEAAGVSHVHRTGDWTPGPLVQIATLQTEHSKVSRRGQWSLSNAKLVIVDEAHLQTGPTVQRLLKAHEDSGATVVGLTATPIGLAGLYSRLVLAGTTSELRDVHALVPALHYGPDEPDMKAWKIAQEGVVTEGQSRKAMMTPGIFGRVWEWFQKLNPEHKPTILFAPGVEESYWFAQQFEKQGISAAHIDGEDVYVGGKLYRSNRDLREEVLDGSANGKIKVLCNRFVLREGIDAPWLCHGIFATIFGQLQSYLQSGGRLLRAFPQLTSVTIQDHGGNWWRYGSLNSDRTWELDCTEGIIAGRRADHLRSKRCRKCKTKLILGNPKCPKCGLNNELEPWSCPQCRKIMTGRFCACGYAWKQSRAVIGTNGQLKELGGAIFRPRPISKRPDGPAKWKAMYFRSCTVKGRRTFRAAAALFAQENHWQWPDPEWPFMPLDEGDWYRKVDEVPKERLRNA